MYHLDNNSGALTRPDIPAVQSSQTRWFTEGGNGTPPSYPGAHWFNTVQAELLGVLTAAGVTPQKHQLNQVTQAIQALITRQINQHVHTINQVTGLSAALNGLSTGKANISHQHQIADIQNLQGSLDSKASKATTLAGYGITDSIHFVQDNYAGDLNDLEGQNVAYAINHESNSNANFPPGLAYKWGILQTMSTGMFTRQIYYPDNPAGGIWTRNKFQSNDWDAWHRVDVSSLFETVGDVTNLCLDPSLLEPKLGFTWRAGATQGEAVDGRTVRVISDRDNYYSRQIKVKAGDKFYLSARYKRKQGVAPIKIGLLLDWDKSSRRTLPAENSISTTLADGTTRLEGYVTIPDGYRHAQFWLQIDQYNTNSTQYYVDNVEWRRVSGKVVSVLSGVINNGGVLPLPAGFTEQECRFMVSVQSSNPNGEQWDWNESVTGKHYRTVCSNSGRTVQCVTYVNEGISGSGAAPKIIPGMANYLVIGVKN